MTIHIDDNPVELSPMISDAPFRADPVERGHAVRGYHFQTGAVAIGTLLADDSPEVRWVSTPDGVVPVNRDTVARVSPATEEAMRKLASLADQTPGRGAPPRGRALPPAPRDRRCADSDRRSCSALMGAHEPGSHDRAWIEYPRWLRFLAFTAAVLALVAAIVALGVVTVLLVS